MHSAKGKLYLNEEDIRNIFTIPNNVFIKCIEHNPYNNEIEILLISENEIEGWTYEAHDYYGVGRKSII